MTGALPLALGLAAALLAMALPGAVLARTSAGTPAVYGAVLALSAALLAVAVLQLAGGASPAPSLTLPLGLPWLGAHFRFDALSAFFLAVINLGGAAASAYGLGYGRHETGPQRVLPFYPLFLGGMSLVVLADDAFSFLFAWEFMSLASWALVMAHHRDEGNARAGLVYIVMAAFSTLALLLAFGLLAGTAGDYSFEAIRARPALPYEAALVLGLALLGAGSKAGIVPLHVWLPLAHPAAPSHVSALMSGVMTKVAIYGFVRIVFDLLGPPGWWWSIPVLAAGGGTAVMGVLYALMQHDLKRLLAYHTVENIGIIFIGLGLALAFRSSGMLPAAALAITAGLLHVFNHSLFKSLLFFGAGTVLTATGTRELDHLGGLIHRMPWTAFYFLVGCAAISALPPFNGFVSEWLTFQAILLSPGLPSWGLKLLVPTVGALLALSAALAAACFVKAFGIAFLGRPRTEQAKGAHETGLAPLGAMSVLAALCLIAGIVPGIFIDALGPAALEITGQRMPRQFGMPWLSIVPAAESSSSYNGLLVFFFIAASASLTAFIIHRFASRAMRRGPAWGCGFPHLGPSAQYSAGSFAQPLRRVFGTYVFRAREQIGMPPPGDLAPARFHVDLHDLAWDLIYTPVTGAVSLAATRLNQLQFLTIRRYLSFVFLALVFLLLVLALWS
ncbi:MAG TPA: hydrogenase 4 subunit B [Methylocella sp.]|nr:hydrogenase 4 subunit B [Methylocella sp.]